VTPLRTTYTSRGKGSIYNHRRTTSATRPRQWRDIVILLFIFFLSAADYCHSHRLRASSVCRTSMVVAAAAAAVSDLYRNLTT